MLFDHDQGLRIPVQDFVREIPDDLSLELALLLGDPGERIACCRFQAEDRIVTTL